MKDKEKVRISKFMSLLLRHEPGKFGLTLDEDGWASTRELIAILIKNGLHVTEELLKTVVETNDKKRFSLNADSSRIRANQGHSIEVNLGLAKVTPPAILYHGTGENNVVSILATGIQKRERQHVHLSKDIETAVSVGKRHGKPIVLVVDAGEMVKEGYSFYQSANNVWLTDFVPAKFLTVQ